MGIFWRNGSAKREDGSSKVPTSGLSAELREFYDREVAAEQEPEASATTSTTSDFARQVHQARQDPSSPEAAAYIESLDQAKAISSNRRGKQSDGALRNCTLFQIELQECLQHGSFWERSTMCETKRKAFWDCFHQQKQILSDFNYGAAEHTPQLDGVLLDRADALGQDQHVN